MVKIKVFNNKIINAYMIVAMFYLIIALCLSQFKITVNNIPQSVYLIILVGLFFLYTIVFLFMFFQYLCRRDLTYIIILGLAFLSCNIYFSETIFIIHSLINKSFSIENRTNDIAIFYFFRQLNFVTLLFIAIKSYSREFTIIETKERKPCFVFLSLFITIIIAFLAHNLSSYNPSLTLKITSLKNNMTSVHWNLKYVYITIVLWVCALILLTIKTKLKNPLWLCVALLCCSSILTNVILIKLDEYDLYIWYVSRGIETIFSLCIISILMYNTFVLLKKETESSIRDEMTSLYNRKLFYKALKSSIKKRAVCVIMFDIDKFKRINDTYGHQEGDHVIISIVDIINNSIGSCDLFARIGGEEFAIILQCSDKCEAMIVAERMRLNVEKNTSIQNKYNLKETMTISIGVYCSCASDYSVDKIVSYADHALYKAKNTGRNKAVYYQM